MLTEQEIEPRRGPEVDMASLNNGRAVLLYSRVDRIRIVRRVQTYKDGNGNEIGPGIVVEQFLRSQDGLHDDDIITPMCRYSTHSGKTILDFYPVSMDPHTALQRAYRYGRVTPPLTKNGVRKILHNRIKKFL